MDGWVGGWINNRGIRGYAHCTPADTLLSSSGPPGVGKWKVMEDLRWVGEIRLWPGRCHPGAKGHMPSGMRGWAAGPVHGAVSTLALPPAGQVSCTGARPCVPAFSLCWAPALAPNWHQLLRVVPALGAPRGVGGNPRDWLGIWAPKHTRPLLPPTVGPQTLNPGLPAAPRDSQPCLPSQGLRGYR